jgi:hypothetical protein
MQFIFHFPALHISQASKFQAAEPSGNARKMNNGFNQSQHASFLPSFLSSSQRTRCCSSFSFRHCPIVVPTFFLHILPSLFFHPSLFSRFLFSTFISRREPGLRHQQQQQPRAKGSKTHLTKKVVLPFIGDADTL